MEKNQMNGNKNVGSITLDGQNKVYVVVTDVHDPESYPVYVAIRCICNNLVDAVEAQKEAVEEGRRNTVIQVVSIGDKNPFENLRTEDEDEDYEEYHNSGCYEYEDDPYYES
jgi:hypothetical protein